MASEEAKITEYFAKKSHLNSQDFPIGIGDDMAQMQFAPGVSALITTDMLLEGTHFDLADCSIEQVGYKSMAVSLSDCAAMASVPFAAVVSVGLPKGFTSEQLKEFHAGIRRAGDKYNCSLIGGDITSWSAKDGKLAVSVAMLSRPLNNEPVQRTTAKRGDVICVTGSLGGSLAAKHLEFEPRVEEALRIAELSKVNSMMDLSDGLSSDLSHICRLSGVGAVVYADRIPTSAQAQKSSNPLASALNDGEDFELLFTLSDEQHEKLMQNWNMDVPITHIGKITDCDSCEIVMPDGSFHSLEAAGYDHLR